MLTHPPSHTQKHTFTRARALFFSTSPLLVPPLPLSIAAYATGILTCAQELGGSELGAAYTACGLPPPSYPSSNNSPDTSTPAASGTSSYSPLSLLAKASTALTPGAVDEWLAQGESASRTPSSGAYFFFFNARVLVPLAVYLNLPNTHTPQTHARGVQLALLDPPRLQV